MCLFLFTDYRGRTKIQLRFRCLQRSGLRFYQSNPIQGVEPCPCSYISCVSCCMLELPDRNSFIVFSWALSFFPHREEKDLASAYSFNDSLRVLEICFGFRSWQNLMHLPAQSNPPNTQQNLNRSKGSYGTQNPFCPTKSRRKTQPLVTWDPFLSQHTAPSHLLGCSQKSPAAQSLCKSFLSPVTDRSCCHMVQERQMLWGNKSLMGSNGEWNQQPGGQQ